MYFVKKLNSAQPRSGQIALFWLGQAGFLIKNSKGEILALDPYFSDMVEKNEGIKRLMMPVMEPEELDADIILVTHYHGDHLDLDSLPAMLKPCSELLCCSQSFPECRKIGIPETQMTVMEVGSIKVVKGFTIEAVFADHGDGAPSALGYIVETEGIRIYFSGDTSYQRDRMQYAAGQDIDILVVPINGEYGNMNERDAAMLAAQVRAKITIPSHFWLFARHMGSPYAFEQEMRINVPECKTYMMCQGECLYYPAKCHVENI